MKTLSDGQLVFNPLWGDAHLFFIGTVEGMCRRRNILEVEHHISRTIRQGEPLAYAYQSSAELGVIIHRSASVTPAFTSHRLGAIPVQRGDVVEIEGRTYEVDFEAYGYRMPNGILFLPLPPLSSLPCDAEDGEVRLAS